MSNQIALTDPKLVIKSLLEKEWKLENTLGVTPKFSTGWYEQGLKLAQVTVTGDDENGDYHGITSQGGPTKRFDGTLDVNTWANRNCHNDPKSLVFVMSKEIERIIDDNYDKLEELELIGYQRKVSLDQTDISPKIYRYLNIVAYNRYTRR
ncbi:hypothetical protein [Natroniella sp. ANB-PHB2]|uniref:hypothetical protein n=1 Tax=Natroniella sp. ANB-PHB2 TaxID=3384444 RepID=UPI0038D471DB